MILGLISDIHGITSAGYFDFLAGLRSELRLTLPDGTRVLGVHASPHSDDGQGIDTVISDGDLSEHRIVDYDHRAELDVLDRVRHPAASGLAADSVLAMWAV